MEIGMIFAAYEVAKSIAEFAGTLDSIEAFSNPSTAITFSLPRAGHVTLKVFNSLDEPNFFY
jgi:hypothetical protein